MTLKIFLNKLKKMENNILQKDEQNENKDSEKDSEESEESENTEEKKEGENNNKNEEIKEINNIKEGQKEENNNKENLDKEENNIEKDEEDEKDKDNDEEEQKEINKENEQEQNKNNIQTSSNNSGEDETFFKQLVFSKYKPVKKLGEGSFGKVYKAEYNSQYYAIKFEDREEGQDLLQNEATIMSYLKGNPHIPKVRSYGFKGNYNILVMQLLDKSLEDIFNIRKKFSFKTGAMLGYQMLTVLQYIHEKHIIHRDIKPDNFVLGSGELNAYLYLVDFGLAKKYRSSKTLKQYPYIKKKKLTGTARYASIHAMEEMEQSRRDDLEAVGYVLMYFIRGNLPWQGLKLKSNEDRYKKILDKKKEVSTAELCSECPRIFFDYVDYSKKLGFAEEPNYELYKKKFLNYVVNIKKEKFDYIFDWTTENDLKKRKEEFNLTCEPLEGEDNEDNNPNLNDIYNSNNKSKKNTKKKTQIENNNNENNGNNENNENEKENNENENNENNENDENNENNKENKENKENEEKVESGCCLMQVNIFFNYFIVFDIFFSRKMFYIKFMSFFNYIYIYIYYIII